METNTDFLEPTQTVDEFALDSIIEQYGEESRAMVKIYRVEKGETDALLEEVEPSGFEFIHFARKHGRGTYRIKVYAPNEFGKPVMKVNKLERYAGAVDAAIIPAQADGSTAVMELAKTMLQGFEKLGALIVQTQTPAVDPAAQRRAMLEEMALMRDMFAPAASIQPVQSMESMMALFRQGLEMGQGMTGEPAEGMAGFMQAIKPLVEPLGRIVENITAKQAMTPAAPRAALAAPVARPDVAAPGSPATEYQQEATTQESNDMNLAALKYRPFKQYIDQLVATVERNPNTDPYAYACMILDNLPDDALNVILADDKLIDNFASIAPGVTTHRAWFDDLAKELHDLTKPEEPDTVASNVPDKPIEPPVGT
jgi:hypothetical protein